MVKAGRGWTQTRHLDTEASTLPGALGQENSLKMYLQYWDITHIPGELNPNMPCWWCSTVGQTASTNAIPSHTDRPSPWY